ncbi:tubulin-like doman-containing protein [Desulfonema magnum]|uniref:Uncharacterized protein n=1 Tax=Desulfonema magnum TaxID=45655 RepID=A0A975GN56_9BACT|nr:tubulin-like doman-containing protein [Desulfonema magnum]QTA86533.1 Uncharacterized protein dnm_025570 [Desulfonema magnum]
MAENFGSLKVGKLPDELLEDAPVGKTLLIGLGGTGKEVLLRFRRLVTERFGSLDALPCVQFLHLDTDMTANAMQQYDKTMQDDPLYEKIMFQPIERVNLTIEGGISKYLGNINAYSHIREWFHTKGKIADLGDLGEGAGQVRMASRLGFYDKYDDIEAGLANAENRLSAEGNRDVISQLGFKFDPNVMSIYVISSLAGGTGSGTFLDMGFLVKTMFPDSTRIGVFFMPAFFGGYSGAGRMKANGYAALKELNHYSFGHSFAGNWTGRASKPIFPPPFDYTYLLEGKNEANEAIGSSNEEYSMYQMVSEIIFQDFSVGDFAGMKRAIRVNLKNFIDNAYVHNYWDAGGTVGVQGGKGSVRGDSYTTRFCSFGLAAIYFPVEKLHRACACLLSKNILDLWQKHVVDDPMEILFKSFLTHSDIKFVQGYYTRRDGAGTIEGSDVETELLVYNKEAGQDFPGYLWNKVLDIRTETEAQPNGQKAAMLQARREELEQFLARADSDNPDEWGLDIRTIQRNMENYLGRLKRGLEEQASELSNDPRYGISYALSLLRELKKLLRDESFNYLPYFEGAIPYWDGEIQNYIYQLDQLQMDISKHESRFLFREADLARDMDILAPPNVPGEGVLYNYLLARVMKQVMKRGKLICERIDKFLGQDSSSGEGLLAKYHQLTGGMDKLRSILDEKQEYFSREEESATLKSLYRDGDVNEWYNIWMGEPEQHKQNLKEVSDKLLTKIFGVDSVTEALSLIQSQPIENIEDQMLEECRIFFAIKNRQPSALEMLMDEKRCSKRDRENLIETAYRRAKVWLRPNNKVSQVQFKVRQQQKPCIIGIDEEDRVRFNEFQGTLKKKMATGDTQPQFKNIGKTKKGSIIFYNELGGATAFYPSSVTEVGGLSQNYEDFCRNPKDVSPDNQEDVHIDKNRFQFEDIIPKTSDEVRKYSESIRAFVLARLLGLLKVREIVADDQTVVNRYSYEQEVAFDTMEEDLGDEFAAVDILYRDTQPDHESHRRKISDQVENVVEELRRRGLLPVYLLLIEFYLNHVYPPVTEDDEAAGVSIIRYSPYYAALDFERGERINKELITTKEERAKTDATLQELRGNRPKGNKLTYEEYANALKPYTKPAGKFEVITQSVVGKRHSFLDALVLNRKRVFSVIIPKTSEESRKYSESIRTFVLARMLGLFKIREQVGKDRQTVINLYSYEREVAFEMTEEDLGDEAAAIEILYQDQRPEHETHRNLLSDQTETVVEELRQRHLLSVYLLLIEFYLTHVYPPTAEDDEAASAQAGRFTFYHALEFERSERVEKELLRTDKERHQVETALIKLRNKPKAQKLTYQEYVNALRPYTKMSGKFQVIDRSSVLGEKRKYPDALVLDRKRIFSGAEDVPDEEMEETPEPGFNIPEAQGKQQRKRPCPECGKPIDIRAIYCVNCKKTIAEHVICQYCEKKTPSDQPLCWNCGREPLPNEETIECQQCYSFEGKASEFPCPECGWDPSQQEADAAAATETETDTRKPESYTSEPEEEQQQQDAENAEHKDEPPPENEFENAEHRDEPPPENEFDIPEDKVENETKEGKQIKCQYCDEWMTPVGSRCSLCGGEL